MANVTNKQAKRLAVSYSAFRKAWDNKDTPAILVHGKALLFIMRETNIYLIKGCVMDRRIREAERALKL